MPPWISSKPMPVQRAATPPVWSEPFDRRMQFIRAAPDERVFYEWKSLHFEKLKGERSHQHSIRLNDQWQLISSNLKVNRRLKPS